jgi:hypothetical protein
VWFDGSAPISAPESRYRCFSSIFVNVEDACVVAHVALACEGLVVGIADRDDVFAPVGRIDDGQRVFRPGPSPLTSEHVH